MDDNSEVRGEIIVRGQNTGEGARVRALGILLAVGAVVAALLLIPADRTITLAWVPAATAFGALATPAAVLYIGGRLLDRDRVMSSDSG